MDRCQRFFTPLCSVQNDMAVRSVQNDNVGPSANPLCPPDISPVIGGNPTSFRRTPESTGREASRSARTGDKVALDARDAWAKS